MRAAPGGMANRPVDSGIVLAGSKREPRAALKVTRPVAHSIRIPHLHYPKA